MLHSAVFTSVVVVYPDPTIVMLNATCFQLLCCIRTSKKHTKTQLGEPQILKQ